MARDVSATAQIDRFATARWTAGIIGLGYVGLPLAITAHTRGLDVIGYDVSEAKVAELTAGVSRIEDVTNEELAAAVAAGVEFTTDANALGDADALFIAVPSPLGPNRRPDMRFIEAAANTIAQIARPGQLIALESTTYPGTTEEYLLPAVAKAGLVLDENVYVAFSPERVDPGNVLHTAEIPKVVGGVSATSTDVAAAAYRRLVTQVHVVSSAKAAELTKLLENTYRAVNIALVNELAQVAHAFGIDIWEVIDAAATKPFGFQPFYPGPGVGGHCIPLDPQFLAWRARDLNAPTRFIDLAETVNLAMPEYVISRLATLLHDHDVTLANARVFAIGVAYKRNIADERESPAMDVLRGLAARGVTIDVHDPHVPHAHVTAHGFTPHADVEAAAHADVTVILTDHDAIDYERLVAVSRRVFDTRGVLKRRGIDAPHISRL
jgi:UDP-N-acetyl-D-glucosamine dehydrogenase